MLTIGNSTFDEGNVFSLVIPADLFTDGTIKTTAKTLTYTVPTPPAANITYTISPITAGAITTVTVNLTATTVALAGTLTVNDLIASGSNPIGVSHTTDFLNYQTSTTLIDVTAVAFNPAAKTLTFTFASTTVAAGNIIAAAVIPAGILSNGTNTNNAPTTPPNVIVGTATPPTIPPADSTEIGVEFFNTPFLSTGGNTFHVFFNTAMTVVASVPVSNYEFYGKGTKIAVTAVKWEGTTQSIDITYTGVQQTLAVGESAYVITFTKACTRRALGV